MQMLMMQQGNFPPLGPGNTYPTQTGYVGQDPSGQPSAPPVDEKKDFHYNSLENNKVESVIDGKASQSKTPQRTEDQGSKQDNNGNSYYRDNNSHGNSKTQSPSNAGGIIQRSNFKRINGSRFSDAKDTIAEEGQHQSNANGDGDKKVEHIDFQVGAFL